MAWTSNTPNSRIFEQAILNPLGQGVVATTGFPTGYHGTAYDVIDVALFGTGVTPDASVAVASTGYNTGTWTTSNEVTSTSGNWAAGGVVLVSPTWALDTASYSLCFHSANTAGGGNVTIAAAYGCLVYDTTISAGTVAKQGFCYNYFGGSQSVTAGTFTIIWATVGATTAVFNIAI